MSQMDTADAAHRLGVSRRQVQRLVSSGDLVASTTVGRSHLVDAASVATLAQTRAHRGRPLSPQVSWGLLWAWGGLDAAWLADHQRRRVRRLLDTTDPQDLAQLTRRRADVTRWRASASYLDEIAARVRTPPPQSESLGLTGTTRRIDGYVLSSDIAELSARHALVADPNGNVVLRATEFAAALEGTLPDAVVGVDLSTSLDARERRAGLDLLERLRRDRA